MKKVVLITGASAGIGKESAMHLVSEGYTVYGAARRVEKMADLKEAGVRILKMDMVEEKSLVKAVNTVIKDEGRIDVLFNNAGFGLYGSVEETSMEDARYQLEVNIFGLARLTQLLIPHMREQKSGTIINTSSVGGKIYSPMGAWYYATKHALEGWSDCLRLELEQFGIHVVIVEPGLIETEFGEVMFEPFLRRSGNGPYKNFARAFEGYMQKLKEKPIGSHPSVIAKVISRALRAQKPKTRYAAGKFAPTLLFVRKLMSDRMYDKMVMRMFNVRQ